MAGALVFVVLLWGVLVYLLWGTVERVTREPWQVAFDYLSGIHFRDGEMVDRETCGDSGGQARELARTVWRELDQVPRDFGAGPYTSAQMEYLPDDPVPAGDEQVRVPVAVDLLVLNVPADDGRSSADYRQRYRWTMTLEHRWVWCVVRVDRDRSFT